MMNLRVFGIFSVLLAIGKYVECQNVPSQKQSLFCADLQPQNGVAIDQVGARI